jgi:hypothetical protein
MERCNKNYQPEVRLINVHTSARYHGPAGTVALPVRYMPKGGMDEECPHVVRTVDSLIAASAIVGESLAGLFVVETFLEQSSLFTHYLALDPSLWWSGGALIDSAASRRAALDGVFFVDDYVDGAAIFAGNVTTKRIFTAQSHGLGRIMNNHRARRCGGVTQCQLAPSRDV